MLDLMAYEIFKHRWYSIAEENTFNKTAKVSMYKNNEHVLPFSIPWPSRVLYVDTERQLRCITIVSYTVLPLFFVY